MPEQQIVEIAKAIGADARIVIMDEPTAALTEREVSHLFGIVAHLRQQGAGIVYITHRLDEVFALADRVTVLRDGVSVATRDGRRSDPGRGHRADDRARARDRVSRSGRSRVARLRSSCAGSSNRAAGIRDVSLTVHRGEVLGIAGLVGSGRTQVAETIFGLTPADSGEVLVEGAPVRIGSPADAIRAGIAYVPEDRRQHGVVLEMSVAANASLASLDRVSRSGLIDDAAERRAAQQHVDRFRIKTASLDDGGRHAVRRQPAEGRPGALAVDVAARAPARRADAGRRRRLEGGDSRA